MHSVQRRINDLKPRESAEQQEPSTGHTVHSVWKLYWVSRDEVLV